ncbi:protein-disulfide reductase DsbD [Aliidiomarina sanyensis]|uniref:Thiol:disulfide interchange protein DsbD n=2 Tax=Aliidiomarina sanyensis TaxID=1249555 RepID=A0A432WAT4_9GAMM|nr:protein-disulfide reductase DsbD [Aliidiomarina sanyensis]
MLLSFIMALGAWVSVGNVQAQPSFFSNVEGQFLPVQQAFPFSYHQDGDRLYLNFEITEGYYLYQHRFGLTPEHLVAKLHPLPEGIEHNDEFFGDSIIYRDYVTLTVDLATVATGDVLNVRYQGCADAGLCYAPEIVQVFLSAAEGGEAGGYQLQDFSATTEAPQTGVFSLLQPDRLWLTAGIFLLLGLGLAFTPCVFPMYPIISGIIINQQRGGQKLSVGRGFMLSFVYVQGMAITYTLLGILVALAGMQYQAYLQHPALLGTLAALFILFALAMFGVIQVDLPSGLKQKLTEISSRQKGGAYPGVFAMGALSGMIASPCTTAPLSGALLFIAQSGDVMVGGFVLYALSIGMGLPLILIGMSGGKLLPKSGQWMNTVKILFGILMLAVALFLVERLLHYTVAGWLWILFFIGSALLLLRELWKQLGTAGRAVSAVILISLAATGVKWQLPYVDGSFAERKLEFIHVESLNDVLAEVAQASEDNQWVMLDLYADWCVACLELERYTFADPDVQARLENFRVLQADVTAINATNTELLSTYQVLGLPTVLFFDRHGTELTEWRVTGFLNAERFEAHLEAIMNRE